MVTFSHSQTASPADYTSDSENHKGGMGSPVACCLGFFGFMRAGEFTVTSAADFDPATSGSADNISVDSRENPSMVCVHLRQSKTDPFRKGVSIYLGRTHGDLCYPGIHCSASVSLRISV